MMRHALLTLLLAATLPAAHAADKARQEPVNLRADRIEIDQKTGISRYLGHVRLTQGTLRLTADRAEARQRGEALESVIAHGKPATFRERPEGQTEFIDGQAARAEYYALERRVALYGGVDIQRGRDHLRAGEAHYDMTSGTLRATSDATQRVYAALAPATERAKPEEDKP